nr:probable 6-phosphogluconolactonase 4, chloroplastic [Tanacetum cinerariifolium]
EDATDAVKVTLGKHADYGYPLHVQKVKPEGVYYGYLFNLEAPSLILNPPFSITNSYCVDMCMVTVTSSVNFSLFFLQ